MSYDLLVGEAGRGPQDEREKKAARGTVALLGGLPLALELAGAYLSHRRTVTFEQYFGLITEDLKSAFPKTVSSFTKHEADLFSTLRLSEELLREEDRLRQVLDLLTWSGSAPMSIELISHLLSVANDSPLSGELGLGVELRLLQQSPGSDSYSLHRLVGEVRREEIPLARSLHWVDRVCERLGDWFQEMREDFSQLSRVESEIDHLTKWQQNAATFAPSQASRLMWLQAYPAYHRGRYIEARGYITEAQRIFEEVGSTDRELHANLLNDLASIDWELGDHSSVLTNYKRALEIRTELFGKKHCDVATSLANLAVWYGEHGQLHRAMAYSQQALEMRKDLFGQINPDVANSLNNVGFWYIKQGDLIRALDCYHAAIDILYELFGTRHPNIAKTLSNLGSTYGQMRDLASAVEYSERALEMRRELFGESHPDLAMSFNNAGFWYSKQGDTTRALKYSEQALQMFSRLLGERHPSTITAVKQVVSNLVSLGRRHQAYKVIEHALGKVSSDEVAKHQLKELLSGLMQRGFRQPSKKGKLKKKKRR